MLPLCPARMLRVMQLHWSNSGTEGTEKGLQGGADMAAKVVPTLPGRPCLWASSFAAFLTAQ